MANNKQASRVINVVVIAVAIVLSYLCFKNFYPKVNEYKEDIAYYNKKIKKEQVFLRSYHEKIYIEAAQRNLSSHQRELEKVKQESLNTWTMLVGCTIVIWVAVFFILRYLKPKENKANGGIEKEKF